MNNNTNIDMFKLAAQKKDMKSVIMQLKNIQERDSIVDNEDNKSVLRLNNVIVLEVKDSQIKSVYTKEVLEKLPEWFGNKQALDDYVAKAAELPYWAALNKENNCIGFFTVKMHYGHTGDIFVCGVLPQYQRNGIGKALYNIAETYLIQNGCKYILVKTLSDTVSYEPYARTREFYKSVGFEPLISLTEMWDEENPCLIMLKALT